MNIRLSIFLANDSFELNLNPALGEVSRGCCSIRSAMRYVGNVTQFVLNKSRRNRIEVHRFRRWKNNGNRKVLQYNCDREVERRGAATFSRHRNPPRRNFVYLAVAFTLEKTGRVIKTPKPQAMRRYRRRFQSQIDRISEGSCSLISSWNLWFQLYKIWMDITVAEQ